MNAQPETWEGVPIRRPPEIHDTATHIATALARAQGAFEPIRREKTVLVRTKTGGSYSFSYAPLEAILRAVQPALSEEGLALSQNIVADGSQEYVETILSLGPQFLTTRVKIITGESGPQAYGSALTYARRYGITLLLCVCADEDDDANTAEGNEVEEKRLSQDAIKALALKLKTTYEAKIDGAAYELHEEANKEQELYRAAWHLLSSDVRSGFKKMVDRHKATLNSEAGVRG
jgi:hypothetical protein